MTHHPDSYTVEEARAYLETQDAFETIVEGIPAVTYVDADDDFSTPLYISPQCEEFFGYSRERWLTEPELWLNNIHAEDRDWVVDESLRCTASGDPFRAEYRFVTASGRAIWVRDGSAVVYDADGRPIFWRGVMLDVTEVKETEERLKRSLDMLRSAMTERRMLLRRVEDSAELERRNIAADIHDDSIQVMASVSLRLQTLLATAPEGQQSALDEIREMVDESIERLRTLVFELRPPALESKGLVAGLRQYLHHAGDEAGFDFRVEDHLDVEPPDDVRMQMYRIAQEAITNIRKHAGAKLVQLRAETRGSGIAVRIQDDGCGFELAQLTTVPGHLGIPAMRERAEMAGGFLEVESTPEQGTTIDIWLPVEPPVPSERTDP